MGKDKDRRMCRHCGEKPVNRPRGLCWNCYYTPAVLALYPSVSKYAPVGVRNPPACWACGAACPTRSVRRSGWFRRQTRVSPGAPPVMECYCPACFHRYGWPPETHYDAPPDAVGVGVPEGDYDPRVYRTPHDGMVRRKPIGSQV